MEQDQTPNLLVNISRWLNITPANLVLVIILILLVILRCSLIAFDRYEIGQEVRLDKSFYYLLDRGVWDRQLYLVWGSDLDQFDIVGYRVRVTGVVESQVSRGWLIDRYKVKVVAVEPIRPLLGRSLWRWLAGLITTLETRVENYFPWPESALVKGLLFGRRQALGRWRSIFQTTGTSHVVAASGFNVMLVFGAAFYLVALITRRWLALLVGLLVVWLYAVMISFQPPVVRAAVGASLLVVSQLWRAGRSGWYLFALGMLGLVIIDPWLIFSLSFQLSVAAVVGLMLFGFISLRLFNWLPVVIRQDVAASWAAQVMVIPIISWYFGGFSLVGLVVNGLVLWTVPVLTFGGGAVLLLDRLIPSLAAWLAGWLYYPAYYFMLVTQWAAAFNWGFWWFRFNLPLMVAYYLILLRGWWWLKRRFGS